MKFYVKLMLAVLLSCSMFIITNTYISDYKNLKIVEKYESYTKTGTKFMICVQNNNKIDCDIEVNYYDFKRINDNSTIYLDVNKNLVKFINLINIILSIIGIAYIVYKERK